MRLTRKNPVAGTNIPTYRIPFVTDELFREDKFLGSKVIFGAVADVLGKYEDIGSVEEILDMKQELIKYQKGEQYEGNKGTGGFEGA